MIVKFARQDTVRVGIVGVGLRGTSTWGISAIDKVVVTRGLRHS